MYRYWKNVLRYSNEVLLLRYFPTLHIGIMLFAVLVSGIPAYSSLELNDFRKSIISQFFMENIVIVVNNEWIKTNARMNKASVHFSLFPPSFWGNEGVKGWIRNRWLRSLRTLKFARFEVANSRLRSPLSTKFVGCVLAGTNRTDSMTSRTSIFYIYIEHKLLKTRDKKIPNNCN